MRRGFSLSVSVAILAIAGGLAIWLVFHGPDSLPILPAVPQGPASRVTEQRPETRRVAPPPAAVHDERPPAAADAIEGVILDESGHPVPDATVQIVDFRYVSASTRPPDRRFEDRIAASTVSGDDGRYAFTGLVAREVKILKVSKPGFVTQMKDGIRVPGRRDFRLVPGAVVTGRVLSATTKLPIEGVGIKGWYPAGAQPIDPASGFRWKEEVFTNPKGDFTFEGAPAGSVRFMLAHPAYEDVDEEHPILLASTNELLFQMKLALVVEGVVVHAFKETPVANLDVAAFDATPIAIAPRWRARTGPDGRFRMPGVRSGGIRFEISGRGFTPAQELRELTTANDFSGTNEPGLPLSFKIVPAGRAAGRVVTVNGDPVARARMFVAPVKDIFVVVRDPAQHGGSAQDGETRTDEKGGFLVDDLTPIPHRAIAEAPGFGLAASEAFTSGPDEIRENVILTLRPAPMIRGAVTDESHVPVANAVITIELPQFGEVWFPPGFDVGQKAQRTVATDQAGFYKIEVPYGGKFEMRVDHPDFVLVEGVVVTLKDLEAEVVQDFTLKSALSISGTVIGPGGHGEPGAVVRAWPAGGGGGEAGLEARSGASGGYVFARVGAGLYRMHAKKTEANLTSEFRNEVPSGSEAIDFRLVPGAEVIGAVTDVAGAPIPAFQVALRPVGQRSGPRDPQRKRSIAGLSEREEEVQDPGGLFHLQVVDPGVWTLQILSKDYAPSRPVELAVTGGAVVSAGTIVLTPGGAVSGRITAPGGQAAEGVTVTLMRIGKLPDQEEARPVPQNASTARSGPTGDYAVRGLVPGEYLFRAESPGFVDPPQERFAVHEGEFIERSLKLRPAASLTLSVKDEVGEPVPAVVVTVRDALQRKVAVQIDQTSGGHTDAAGRAVLRKLPAGEDLTIHLMRPGFEVRESPQKLLEGDNGAVEIRLPRIHN